MSAKVTKQTNPRILAFLTLIHHHKCILVLTCWRLVCCSEMAQILLYRTEFWPESERRETEVWSLAMQWNGKHKADTEGCG